MPEFKLNGKTYSGSTSYASAIDYTEADGSKTTVQDKISEMDSNISEQNKNLPYKIWQEMISIDVGVEGMKEIPYPIGCSIINTNFLTFTVMYDTHIQHITPTIPNLLDVQLLKDKIRIYVKSELVVGKQVSLSFMSNVN